MKNIQNLDKFPNSVVKVYDTIISNGKPITLEELQKITKISYRTIRRAVNHLIRLNLIKNYPNLTDLRSYKMVENKS